ncbi:MAG: formylglycine-generating enzyme family protein [Blastocatellia bacterium]
MIEIDGSVKGFAGIDGNLFVLGVASGSHQLSASLIGYENWSGTFVMGIPTTSFVVPMKKKPAPGKIAITVSEPDVEVIVDGQERLKPKPGQPVLLSDLATGIHRIIARKRKLRDWSATVSVEPGKTSAVKIEMKPAIDLEMLKIAEGAFEMGDDKGDKAQRPKHQVLVAAFEISRTEIPNRLYKLFVDETGHQPPEGLGYGWHANQYPAGHDDFPVVFVSWDDAVAFCKWLSRETGSSYRLPTEAEWEKAIKERSTHKSVDDAQYKFLSAGRVWEWCSDWYDPDYYKQRDRINPQGPVVGKKLKMMGFEGQTKSLRGGGYGAGQVLSRAAERGNYFADKSRFDIGFRVVRELNQGASK